MWCCRWATRAIIYNDPAPLRFHDPGRDGRASTRIPYFAHLGLEPVAGALTPVPSPRSLRRQDNAAEGRAARPAGDRRARQHLRLRGAVAIAAVAAAARRLRGAPDGSAGQRVAAPDGCDRGGDRGGDRRPAAPRCVITWRRTARLDASSTASPSTAGRKTRARGPRAPASSGGSSSRGAPHGSALSVSADAARHRARPSAGPPLHRQHPGGDDDDDAAECDGVRHIAEKEDAPHHGIGDVGEVERRHR